MAAACLKGYAETDPDVAHSVDIVHLSVALRGKGTRVIREVVLEVFKYRPQVIAFSCNIWNASFVIRCCAWIRRLRPGVLIILGGQEIVAPEEDIIRDYPGADILIEGEGERPFRDLLKTLLERGSDGLNSVKGIHYRCDRNQWAYTGAADRIQDLDSIPSPYLSGNVQLPDSPKIGAMIEISRGCPMKCSFCFEANRYPKTVSFSMDRVTEEFRYLRKLGHQKFHILDPILSLKNRIPDVHEALCNIDMRGTETSCELYADLIKPDHVPLMDFIDVCDIGLQTISGAACKIIRRPFRKERFERGFELLKSYGKVVNLYLLAGIPGDTLESFKQGVVYAQDLKPSLLFLNPLLVLRGTPLRYQAEQLGLVYDSTPPYLATGCNTFPAADLQLAHEYSKRVMNQVNSQYTPLLRRNETSSNVAPGRAENRG